MKMILYFVATVASVVAFAACNFADIDTQSPTDYVTSFVKGQKVTLTVGTGTDTKATGTLNAETGDIDFKWEKGDKIKVTVGEESSEFTLKSVAGTASATFEGTMPGSGDTFDVQFPVTDPDLTIQTYSATEAIPHNMMKFTASNCTVNNPFTLEPQYTALRLNLYGGAREVSQIVITGSSKVTYTLSISSAVTVGKDKENATPFFIVLPANESFVSAAVTANALTATTDNTKSYESYGIGYPISASTTFTATDAKSLTAGSILNMQAVSLTTVWAPVNCGYDATNYKYGRLYQWGRAVGGGYVSCPSQAFDDAGGVYQIAETTATVSSTANTSPVDNVFYKGTSDSSYDWYITTGTRLSSWPMDSGHSQYVAGKIANPCPEGWRVPTKAEFETLKGNHTAGILQDGSGIYSGMKGMYFDGSTSATPSSGVFLPAAGTRNYTDGSANSRGSSGSYWLSSVSNNTANHFCFYNNKAYIGIFIRAYGCSVRCVQE